MIQIDEKLKKEFYKDSINKELVIEFEGDSIDKTIAKNTNLYYGSIPTSNLSSYGAGFNFTSVGQLNLLEINRVGSVSYTLSDFCCTFPFDYFNYTYISMGAKFVFSDTQLVNDKLAIQVYCEYSYKGIDGNNHEFEIPYILALVYPEQMDPSGGSFIDYSLHIENEIYRNDSITKKAKLSKIQRMGLFIPNDTQNPRVKGNLYYNRLQIRPCDIVGEISDYLEPVISDTTPYKEYFKVFKTITNENLISESMKLTESLCSSDNLKLGACESSVFEVTVADIKDDFKNKTISPYLLINIPDANIIKSINFYKGELPYPGSEKGYSANWDSRTFSSIFYTTYMDVSSDVCRYLKPNQAVCFQIDFEILQCTLSAIGDLYITVMPLADWYDADNPDVKSSYYMTFSGDMEKTRKYNTVFKLSDCVNNKKTAICYIPYIYIFDGDKTRILENLSRVAFKLTDINANYLTEGVSGNVRINFNNVQITIVDELGENPPAYNVDNCIAYKQLQGGETIDDYLLEKTKYKIPLGKYVVNDIKVEHERDLIKKTLTCYDLLYKLSENAANWYTSYMYAHSSPDYEDRYDFEYVRQLYSTYFNIAKRYGYESIDREKETLLGEFSEAGAAGWFDESFTYEGYTYKISCAGHYFNINQGCLYRIGDIEYTNTEEYFKNELIGYKENVDSLYRGLFKNASVYVREVDSSGTVIRKYLVDIDDYFAVSEQCSYIQFGYCYGYKKGNNSFVSMVKKLCVYELEKNVNLKNKYRRLLYYKYFMPGKKDIFEIDSSITVRDVIRSLLEMTGCFYNLDRNGNPQFIYCTKAALYPSETLYPDYNLYPRGGNEPLTMSLYRKFECEEYSVQDIGKIQIIKNTNTNEGSVCEWEYVGDLSKLNTYIIDDNIFLCNENMMYEPGSMPELENMLAEMYDAISNMSYTPNTTVSIGMPWIELGDRLLMLTKTGGAESFVFRRTLTGIQALKDTFESRGDEIVEAINKYDY